MHVSPNGAEEGSFVYLAEEWTIEHGGTIPSEEKFPHMFQGMIDDYLESEDH
jgi:hypothetical protein